jgi:hypothetical protein
MYASDIKIISVLTFSCRYITSEDIDVDGRIILKWTLEKQGRRVSSGSGHRPVVGSC